MEQKSYSLINNYRENGSSAICLDIRNSTQLVRSFSLPRHLIYHADFMLEIKELIFQKDIRSDFAVSDTGDGLISLFWDETHAWRALKIAVAMRELLKKSTKRYNQFIKNELHRKDITFGFGLALHSGGSIICRHSPIHRDFMYGVVLNTTARLESFTKTFADCNLLLSGHFKDVLESQTKKYNISKKLKIDFKKWEKKNIRLVTSDRVDIKDAKRRGHTLYTVTETNKILN